MGGSDLLVTCELPIFCFTLMDTHDLCHCLDVWALTFIPSSFILKVQIALLLDSGAAGVLGTLYHFGSSGSEGRDAGGDPEAC